MTDVTISKPFKSVINDLKLLINRSDTTTYTFTIPELSADAKNHYAIAIGFKTVFYLFFDSDKIGARIFNLVNDSTYTCNFSRSNNGSTFTLEYPNNTQWGGVRILYLG